MICWAYVVINTWDEINPSDNNSYLVSLVETLKQIDLQEPIQVMKKCMGSNGAPFENLPKQDDQYDSLNIFSKLMTDLCEIPLSSKITHMLLKCETTWSYYALLKYTIW